MNSTSPTAGVPVWTAIKAGGREQNHVEGIVVTTPIAAGANGGYQSMQHAEGIVTQRAER
jgi:hypothetical protein